MAISSRLSWPYPDLNEDPFYPKFVAMVTAQDATGYANREDRSILFTKGGLFSWNSGTNSLTWSAPIQAMSTISGYHLDIPAGSATLLDGQSLYTVLTRAPVSNGALTSVIAGQIPNTDDAILLAVRNGNTLYFRNGVALPNGSSQVFDNTGANGNNISAFVRNCNGAETATFVQTLPVTRSNTNYIATAADGGRIDGTLSFFVCPISGYTTTQVTVKCTQAPANGDKILFVIQNTTS